MSVVSNFEVIGWVETQPVSGLNCGGWVFIMNVGDDDSTDILSDLSRTQLEIALGSNIDLWSLFECSPTVSQLNTFVGVIDDSISVVRVDSKRSDSFGRDSLNDLAWR